MSLELETARCTYLVTFSNNYRQFLRLGLDLSTYEPPPVTRPPSPTPSIEEIATVVHTIKVKMGNKDLFLRFFLERHILARYNMEE